MNEGSWWNPLSGGDVQCTLCPRQCRISEGQVGFCFVRKNLGGRLMTLAYGRPAQILVDSVEKKPLYHFYPGSRVYSIGTAGCNMGCVFCRTWDSMKAEADHLNSTDMTPEEVCHEAVRHSCSAVAFTFNEPTIWAEYAVAISEAAHRQGLKTVMITNGYISRKAFYDVYRHIDAASVDLKGFSESIYRDLMCSELKPVLDMLSRLKTETGVWLEITNLLIPGVNETRGDVRRLVDWLIDNLGDAVPVHFTAYHPDFQLHDAPHTPAETLLQARQIAIERGLKYAYLGDILSDSGDTRCPSCRRLLIRRSWRELLEMHLPADGRCNGCGQLVPGHFNYREIHASSSGTQPSCLPTMTT